MKKVRLRGRLSYPWFHGWVLGLSQSIPSPLFKSWTKDSEYLLLIAVRMGIEPMTFAVTVRYCNQTLLTNHKKRKNSTPLKSHFLEMSRVLHRVVNFRWTLNSFRTGYCIHKTSPRSFFFCEPLDGFEPPTPALQVRCSTVIAIEAFCFYLSSH